MSAKAARVFAALNTARTPVGPSRPMLDTAVVLGGSIAGLLAARVLADHANSVLIVERDEPSDGERRGVPQGFQGHVLLPGGRLQIERWFPGFTEQMLTLGAVLFTGAMNERFGAVGGMLAHPATLANPSTALRAIGINWLNRRTAALACATVGHGERHALGLIAALLPRGR